MTLDRLLNHSVLQFPSLCNGDDSSAYLMGVLRMKIMHVKCIGQGIVIVFK